MFIVTIKSDVADRVYPQGGWQPRWNEFIFITILPLHDITGEPRDGTDS
jgi:hypothetical protein